MKVRAIKSWQKENKEWVLPGDEFDTDDPLPYLESGLVVPVRKRKIEKAIRETPEKMVTR